MDVGEVWEGKAFENRLTIASLCKPLQRGRVALEKLGHPVSHVDISHPSRQHIEPRAYEPELRTCHIYIYR